MELLQKAFDLLLRLIDIAIHLDVHLGALIAAYGTWTYAIVFAVIFSETGFVVTPFLPGDSLLFALGTFSALGVLDPLILICILIVAAIVGDNLNYWIGRYLGSRILISERIPFFRKEHFNRTHQFYERHGGKTIIIARFIPIIRTYTPFVAGVATMNYRKFLFYDIIGGIVWISLFTLGGYYFGNIPVIKNNFFFVIIAIIFISVMPGVIEFVRMRYRIAKQ